jgi:hypothetical protein
MFRKQINFPHFTVFPLKLQKNISTKSFGLNYKMLFRSYSSLNYQFSSNSILSLLIRQKKPDFALIFRL